MTKKGGADSKVYKVPFGIDECQYLGHRVGNGEVRPESAKPTGHVEISPASGEGHASIFWLDQVLHPEV